SDDRDHARPDHVRRNREAETVDERYPQWNKYDAADASAIEGEAERFRSFAIEPRNDHGVERCTAGHGPAGAAEGGGDKQLPRMPPAGPGDEAKRREHGAGYCRRRKPPTAVDLGQIDDDDCTQQ